MFGVMASSVFVHSPGTEACVFVLFLNKKCFCLCCFLRRRFKSLDMIDDEVRLRSDACTPCLSGVLCLTVTVLVSFCLASISNCTHSEFSCTRAQRASFVRSPFLHRASLSFCCL